MVEDRAVFDCGDLEGARRAGALAAGAGARIDPEPVRARMRRVLVLRPEPGASATVERARQRGLDAVAMPLFEIEPVAWEAPEAGELRRPAADQRQCGAARRRAAARSCAACRSTRSARRPPMPRARRGSTLPRPAMPGSIGCSVRSSRTCRLLHLCGEDRHEPADARQQHHALRRLSRRSREDARSWRRQRLRRADPFAASRAALRRAGRPTAVRLRSPRSALLRRRQSGSGWESGRNGADSRPTMRCWPLRHGCATTSPEMNGTRTGMGWGARLLIALGADHRRALARRPGALPIISRRRGSWASLPTPAAGDADAEAGRREPAAAEPDGGRARRATQAQERRSPASRAASARSRTRPSARKGPPDGPMRWSSPSPRAGRSIAESRSAISRTCSSTASAPQHRAAVATIITASHQPVRLDDLIAEYETLGPDLRRGGPQDSWWTNVQTRAWRRWSRFIRPTRPAANPDARYERAQQRLASGDVDEALAETMRLPGASRAERLDRQGAPLHRRSPRARRDRIGGAPSDCRISTPDLIPAWQANPGMRFPRAAHSAGSAVSG